MSYGVNPIEQNVKAINITTAFKAAVGEKEYETALSILKWLEHKGYRNPVLYGGALRDMFIGEFAEKDFDVDISGWLKTADGSFVNSREMKLKKGERDLLLDIQRRPRMRTNEKTSERALRGDAPINAIAMNSKGNVFAHPQFIAHAKGGIYHLRRDLNEEKWDLGLERFQRLRETYKHWELT